MDWENLYKLVESNGKGQDLEVLKEFKEKVIDKNLEEEVKMVETSELQSKILPQVKRLVDANNLEGAFIMDTEGLPLLSYSKGDLSEDMFAASSASIIASSQLISGDIDKGKVNRVIMETEGGSVMFSQLGDYIVALIAPEDVKLGILRGAVQKLENLLRG